MKARDVGAAGTRGHRADPRPDTDSAANPARREQ